MITVTYNAAKAVAVDLPSRLASDPTATLYDPSAGPVASGVVVTRNSVDTTLAAVAAVGAQALTLTSATGVVSGSRFLVGGPEETGGEFATVKSVSGAVVTLVRPLMSARAIGDAFQSTRVTLTIPALPTAMRGYRIEIASDPPITIPFDVTRYTVTSWLTIENARDLDHHLTKRIGTGVWWPALVAEAFDLLQQRVAVKAAEGIGALQGTLTLTRAHGYIVRSLLAETAGGDKSEEYRVLMSTRAQEELDAALASAKWDTNGDGVAEPESAWFPRSIRVLRS